MAEQPLGGPDDAAGAPAGGLESTPVRATIPAEEVRASTEPLSVVLESMRVEFDFPAMAAFVLRGGNIVEQANVGTRTSKDDTAIGENVRWHIGSNTKAMTATLAGILIEDGLQIAKHSLVLMLLLVHSHHSVLEKF